jgi:hypothetical protein
MVVHGELGHVFPGVTVIPAVAPSGAMPKLAGASTPGRLLVDTAVVAILKDNIGSVREMQTPLV